MIALIPSGFDPDLVHLCLTRLRAYAPQVLPIVIVTEAWSPAACLWWAFPGPRDRPELHGRVLDWARVRLTGQDDEHVLLLDNDVAVGPGFGAWLTKHLDAAAAGAAAHDGYLHPSCCLLRMSVFRQVPSFMGQTGTWGPGQPWRDTGWQIAETARTFGPVHPVPGHHPPEGWVEYGFHGEFWTHLGSGHQSRGPVSWKRRVAAALGHPASREQVARVARRRKFLEYFALQSRAA